MLKLSSRGKKLFECVIASSPHLGGFCLPRVHYQRTGPYNFNLQMIGSRALRADFAQEKTGAPLHSLRRYLRFY